MRIIWIDMEGYKIFTEINEKNFREQFQLINLIAEIEKFEGNEWGFREKLKTIGVIDRLREFKIN